jgi:cytochrome c biogenesis protein CcmG, thiol:disulfide interchange protein DsbE
LKKFLTSKNIFILVILGYFAVMRGPAVIKNFQHEGLQLTPQPHLVISPKDVHSALFPPEKGRALAIFWATWCGPCKVEMNRLKASVESGKIPRDAIFAINPFEDQAQIESFLKLSPYPFIFLENGELSETLQVSVTPTSVWIEDAKVQSINSGMSVFGIWRAEMQL